MARRAVNAAVAVLLSTGMLGCGDVTVLPPIVADTVDCVEGSPCTPAQACHRGMTSCATGSAVCVDAWVAVSDGTACGAGLTCSQGACVTACAPDRSCQSENPCVEGVTSCPTTATDAVCVPARSRQDGTTCGDGRACRSGACVDQDRCRAGDPCQPADPCHEGQLSCTSASHAGTCIATTSKADGTRCGTRQVCRSGACIGPPAIRSFRASPANVVPNSPSTLSWDVSGADALTLDPGGQRVTGTSVTVRPLETTLYTLTASNAAGATQLHATVTVSTIERMRISCGGSDETVRAGRTARITASFQVAAGTPGREIDWWLDPGALGSLSPSRGESTTYTAPDVAGRYRIWGRSTWDPTMQDDCWITVTRSPGQSKKDQ